MQDDEFMALDGYVYMYALMRCFLYACFYDDV